MMRYFRRRFLFGWTIGWDLKNRALLQFTKTVSYIPGHFVLELPFIYIAFASRTVAKKERQYWLNFGWNVGFTYINI